MMKYKVIYQMIKQEFIDKVLKSKEVCWMISKKIKGRGIWFFTKN